MTPIDAVRRAQKLQHPFDTSFQAQDHVLDAMFRVLIRGTEAIHQERVAKLKWLKSRAQQLEVKENALRASLEPKVAEILKSKKLLMLDELIKYVGYADTHLVEDMCKGMTITGEGRCTGCFAPEFKPPMLEKEDLWKGAKSSQKEVKSRIPMHVARREVTVGGSRVDIAQEVWQATLKEVQCGWLEGPLSEDQVSARCQGRSRNQCYGPTRWYWRQHGGRGDHVRVQLSSGLVLEGTKAEEFRSDHLRLSGRCLDLKSAYKQLALAPADRSNAVIAVMDPADFHLVCTPIRSHRSGHGLQPGSEGPTRDLAELITLMISLTWM